MYPVMIIHDDGSVPSSGTGLDIAIADLSMLGHQT